MKSIQKRFHDIFVLFNALRYFYDKLPNRGEALDYKAHFSHKVQVDHTSIGVYLYYVADLQKLKIVEVGGSLHTLVGIHPHEVLDRNFAYALKVFRWSELPDLLKAMIKYHEYVCSRSIEDRLKIKGSIVLNVKKKQGGYFTGLLQAVPLALDSEGNISHMYSSITDISRFQVDPNMVKGDIIDESNAEEIKVISIVDKNLGCAMDLTKSELRILKLISEGKSTKEISDILSLSEHTVNNHRKNMIQKTHVKNTAELVSKTIALSQSF